ncbi:enoyl-CoA hydratase/isomerase family protein [Sandaracinobacter sp. RS1-74]|uniref:enoyl-CoA hydratase/isomerase family protein n=1 Tax=Sandaracinobacteroides sayramensis TaxID=2913411 RepID=UPI001EDBE262|nr:enoyl-CoA hydratase/isomerase family protein [Sandaracinobacteroides sayramensis]MCG2842029.1 enoyl-CoA hydratase/isomerase family protein [Sandaracinobacteroides sayramensis]
MAGEGLSGDGLKFELEGAVALLTLNRPDRGNALDPALLAALERAWRRVDDDAGIRAAIVTGAGERHFCTGADVGGLKVGMGTLNNRPHAEANRFSPRMAHVRKPVICAVNGLCNGGGLHFVAESDIVVASATSAFMDSHVSVGQVSALESQSLARKAGPGAALLLGLAGKGYRMPAERAYTLGLVDLLEPDAETALARAREIAAMVATNSPQAVALTKRAIWLTTEMAEPASSEFGWELLKSHWAHPDFAEGPAAFSERRPPNWNPDPNARG